MKSAGGPKGEGKGRQRKIVRVLESLLESPLREKVGSAILREKYLLRTGTERERGKQLRGSPCLSRSPHVPSGRAAEPCAAPRLVWWGNSSVPRAAVGLHRTVRSPS